MLFLLSIVCVDASYNQLKDRFLDAYDIQLLLFGHLVCINVDASGG